MAEQRRRADECQRLAQKLEVQAGRVCGVFFAIGLELGDRGRQPITQIR
jgi:hypothetical protein